LSESRIFESAEFRRGLARLAAPDAEFVRKKLLAHIYPQLRREPFFGPSIKKLQGYRPTTWRYRIGRFRIFYIVDQEERIVFMLTIDCRKDACR